MRTSNSANCFDRVLAILGQMLGPTMSLTKVTTGNILPFVALFVRANKWPLQLQKYTIILYENCRKKALARPWQ
jgi:hypothetical protein